MARWLRFDVVARTPQLPWLLIVAVLAFKGVSSTIFHHHAGVSDALDHVQASSDGLLRTGLLWGLASNTLLIAMLFGLGGLRPPHLGLDAREFRRWVATLVIAWCAIQLSIVLVAAVAGLALAAPTAAALGNLIAQVFMTGVFEEVLDRGVLLPQFVHWLRAATGKTTALVGGVICSSVVFAAQHLPRDISERANAFEIAGSMGALFVFGAIYALLYLRSGSLLTLAAFHALGNAPTIFLDLTDAQYMILSSAVLIAAALYISLRPWPAPRAFLERP